MTFQCLLIEMITFVFLAYGMIAAGRMLYYAETQVTHSAVRSLSSYSLPCPKHNHHIAMLLAPFSFSCLPCLHNSTEIWQPFSILKIYIYLVRIPLKLLWWVLKHHQWKRERIYLFESAIKLINLISLCVHLMKKQKFNVQTDQFFRK